MQTKKGLLFGFAAAMTLASCTTNDEILETAKQTPMEFGSFVNKGTKAPITNDNMQSCRFGVFGYKYKTSIETLTEADFVPVFDGVPVWHDGTAWTYVDENQPARYWDKTCTYDFYAYAPVDSLTVRSAKGPSFTVLTFTDFKVSNIASTVTETNTDPTKYLEHIDFLVADGLENITSYGSPQQFTFRHILTNVSVKVKKAQGFEGEVEFTSAVLRGVKNKSSQYKHIIGKISIANPFMWSFPKENTADFTSAQDSAKEITEEGIFLFTEMLMIPQKITSNTFDIEYTINGETFTKTLDFAGTWVANQKIIYNIEISASAIDFDVTAVDGWITPETQPTPSVN